MSERKVAVVTGASRGAGRGIAVALGEAGWKVYVTGRTLKEGDAALPGTIGATAAAVTAAGGEGVAVQVDHADAKANKALFDRVVKESGRLDILVNNAIALHDDLTKPENFWEKSADLVDILDVGLRSSYLCAYYAAPIMVKQKSGLILFTSSPGAVCYMHGPAYGAQKAGTDKFAADMGVDFRGTGVAAVSMWMGMLATERSKVAAELHPELYGPLLAQAETPEFNGKVILGIYNDPELEKLNGTTVISAEMALKYGIKDTDDRQPMSHRSMLGDPRIPHPAIVR